MDPRIVQINKYQDMLFRYYTTLDNAINETNESIGGKHKLCEKARQDAHRTLGRLLEWGRDNLILDVLRNESLKIAVADLYLDREKTKLRVLQVRMEEIAAMHFTLKIQERTITESLRGRSNSSGGTGGSPSPSGHLVVSEDFFSTPQELFESSSLYKSSNAALYAADRKSKDSDETLSRKLQHQVIIIPHEERCAHLTSVLCSTVIKKERIAMLSNLDDINEIIRRFSISRNSSTSISALNGAAGTSPPGSIAANPEGMSPSSPDC